MPEPVYRDGWWWVTDTDGTEYPYLSETGARLACQRDIPTGIIAVTPTEET